MSALKMFRVWAV